MLIGFPSRAPLAFRIASAAFVRSEISRLSFFGQRRVQVQHERVGVAAEFSDDEWNALGH